MSNDKRNDKQTLGAIITRKLFDAIWCRKRKTIEEREGVDVWD